jgi:predicted ATPase
VSRRKFKTSLRAPYLKRVTWANPDEERPKDYPFSLPFLSHPDWCMDFKMPVTIIVGENAAGKSTLIEAIAGLAGYDEAGGAKGYRPIDHSRAMDISGTELAAYMRAAWLPKVTSGWFFKAETFWSVARYLDDLPGAGPDYLSFSHGEGFLRVFAERCTSQGLYLMDEPESALSPARQMDLLRMLANIQHHGAAQVIMATHSPILMAVPGAQILKLTKFGLDEVELEDTSHFKLYRAFFQNPRVFVEEKLKQRSADPIVDIFRE